MIWYRNSYSSVLGYFLNHYMATFLTNVNKSLIGKEMNYIYAITNLLDVIALAVLLVSSWIMYKNSHINKPGGLMLESGDSKIYNKKNLWFKRGLLILFIGLLIAFFSLLLRIFYPTITTLISYPFYTLLCPIRYIVALI